MCAFSDLAMTLQTLLTTEAEQAAREAGCVRRLRKLSGATFVQTLVLGWLHDSHASLDSLADFAADLGADLTPQALDQRFTPAASRCLATVLTAALHRVIATTPAALTLLQRFQGVYVVDTTTIALPAALADLFAGCGGGSSDAGQATLKVHACLELTCGSLELDFGSGRQPDVVSALGRGPLPAGALRLADRGFFNRQVLQDYSDQGVFWITRLPAGLVVQPAQGQACSLATFLSRQQGDGVDCWVGVGRDQPLSGRLLARRAPAAVVAKRRQRLHKQAKKKGRKVSAAQQTLCGWTIYLTNLTAEVLRWQEVWVLARARWQIELLFKLWKSHGGLEASRGERSERVLCEVYAKLIGQVIQHWLLVTCAGPSVTYSHPKAARRVRRQIAVLALLLPVVEEVVLVLRRLQTRMQKHCRVQKRGRRPSLYELLLDPDGGSVLTEQQYEEETELRVA